MCAWSQACQIELVVEPCRSETAAVGPGDVRPKAAVACVTAIGAIYIDLHPVNASPARCARVERETTDRHDAFDGRVLRRPVDVSRRRGRNLHDLEPAHVARRVAGEGAVCPHIEGMHAWSDA